MKVSNNGRSTDKSTFTCNQENKMGNEHPNPLLSKGNIIIVYNSFKIDVNDVLNLHLVVPLFSVRLCQ